MHMITENSTGKSREKKKKMRKHSRWGSKDNPENLVLIIGSHGHDFRTGLSMLVKNRKRLAFWNLLFRNLIESKLVRKPMVSIGL